MRYINHLNPLPFKKNNCFPLSHRRIVFSFSILPAMYRHPRDVSLTIGIRSLRRAWNTTAPVSRHIVTSCPIPNRSVTQLARAIDKTICVLTLGSGRRRVGAGDWEGRAASEGRRRLGEVCKIIDGTGRGGKIL